MAFQNSKGSRWAFNKLKGGEQELLGLVDTKSGLEISQFASCCHPRAMTRPVSTGTLRLSLRRTWDRRSEGSALAFKAGHMCLVAGKWGFWVSTH